MQAAMDFTAMSQMCAPNVHVDTMRRLVHVESSFNPYAIGVVGAKLQRQPGNFEEAVSTAKWLQAAGYDFSLGLAQVNKKNLHRYGLTFETAFVSCRNLRSGAAILSECYERARAGRSVQSAVKAAFSCYYSGNFETGFRHGYVDKIFAADQSELPAANILAKSVKGPAVVPPIRSNKRGLPSPSRNGERRVSDQPPVDAGSTSALLF